MAELREIPRCPYCGRIMQLNKAASTEEILQFICGCQGTIFHRNIHRGQKEHAQWVR
jgi:hypothetical protein